MFMFNIIFCHSYLPFLEALPVKLQGMNNAMMCEYIEFVADQLLNMLGYPKFYNTANPVSHIPACNLYSSNSVKFPFMNLISMEGKANFFEKQVSEYRRPASLSQNLLTEEELF